MSESGPDRTPVADPDVCIVGAGPGGSLLADALSSRGHEVVLLEAGPTVTTASKTERMRRQIRPGTNASDVWEMGGDRDAYTTARGTDWPLNERRVKGVGGTTLNWFGLAPRFRPSDFETESRYGVGRDWPLDYDDLRPYYAAAERELGVAGDADAPFEPPREEPYPLQPPERSHSDELFARAGATLDVEFHTVPTARGPGSTLRSDGGGDSLVRQPGERYSADYHAHRAVENGATLIDRAPVRRLEHGPDGDRVTAAVYTTPDGERHRQTADVFVAACGAIETPRLLMLSDSPQHPDGLGNSSGTLGRYLLAQPPAAVVGLVDESTGQRESGSITSGTYQFYDGEGERGAVAITCMHNAGPSPADLAVQEDAWGDRLLEEIKFHHGDSLGLAIRVECRPQADNRVTLDGSTTDDEGDPAPSIAFSPGSYAAEAQTFALDVATDIIEELDGTVVYAEGTALGEDVPPSARGGHHAMGGARMGTDPAESVVDPQLRAHDLQNLYIAGASPFVTSGAADPALTIAALSLRAADHIDARL